MRALGTTESYWGIWPKEDEIYVLRLSLPNVVFDLDSPYDGLKLIADVGSELPKTYNVVGVTVWQWNADELQYLNNARATFGAEPWNAFVKVDVVTRTHQEAGGIITWWRSADKIAESLNDPASYFMADFGADGGFVNAAEWLELTGPAGSVIHWRRASTVWDYSLASDRKQGGPTQAYEEQQGVWVGTADAPQRQIQPTTIPGLPSLKPPSTQSPSKSKWQLNPTVKTTVVALTAGALAYLALTKQGHARLRRWRKGVLGS